MNKLNMFLIPHGTTIEQKSITAATLIFSNTFSVNVMFRRKCYLNSKRQICEREKQQN